MPTYVINTGDGNSVSGVGPNDLLRFLQDRTGWVELCREDWPDRATVAHPDGDGGWLVEIVDRDTRLAATTPNTDAALDVMRSWAEEDDWWQEAFSWHPSNRNPAG